MQIIQNTYNKYENAQIYSHFQYFKINYIIKFRELQHCNMQEIDISRQQTTNHKSNASNFNQQSHLKQIKIEINKASLKQEQQSKSLQLVSKNSQGRYQLNKAALNFLSQINNKQFKNKQIYIFSMIGKSKTGKSFLLNQLLDKDNSQQQNQIIKNQIFQVSNTLSPCTKGIQISKEFITFKQQNTEKVILFLDTEGFGSMETTEQHQIKVFILSLLISSVIMYNSVGTIDQQTLNNFSMAIQISKLFQKKKTSNSKLNKAAPHLLWILRDFTLRLSNKKDELISTNEYLQNCLREQFEPNQQKKKKRAHKQNIRKSIKQIFPKRSCQTLVLPFEDEAIRPQFKTGLKNVKKSILQIVKSEQCRKINLIQLMASMQIYIDFLNQKKCNGKQKNLFPQIETMMSQAKKAQQNSMLKNYEEQIKKLIEKYQTLINQYQNENLALESYLNKMALAKSRLMMQLQQLSKNYNKKEATTSLNDANILSHDKEFSQKMRRKAQQLQFIFMNSITKRITKRIQIVESQRISKQQYSCRYEEGLIKTIEQCLINFQLSVQNISSNSLLQSEYILMLQQFQTILANEISQQQWKIHEAKISIAKYQMEIIYLRKKVVVLNQRETQQNCIKEQLFQLRKEMTQLKTENQQLRLVQNYKNKTPNKIMNQQIQTFDKNKNIQIHLSEEKKNNSKKTHQSLPQINGYTQWTNCNKSFYVPYVNISKPQYLQVQIVKTIVKQDAKGGQYFSFDIQVELTCKKWNLSRKLKDFIQLDHILHIMFPKIQLPICEYLTINSHNKLFRKTKQLRNLIDAEQESDSQVCLISERKKQLQIYLNCLSDIQFIRNSRIFQKFIRINKDYLQNI